MKNNNFRNSTMNYHRKTKFNHKYMFLWVENAKKLVNSYLLIIKALKIQDGC